MHEYLDMAKIIKLQELEPLARANMLSLIVFKDKVDKAGEIYLRHLNKVAESFKESDDKIVALLHDLVEGTTFTFEELEELNFSSNIITTLKLLTNDCKDYDTYIKRIIKSDNILAKKVKIADLLDNMNINRLNKISKDDINRIKNKYLKAYTSLIEDLEKRITL